MRASNIVVASVAILLLVSTAHAIPLRVDIGQSVGGTVTPEAGFDAFTANTSATVTNNYAASFGTNAGMVEVSITSPFYRSTPSGSYPQVTSQPGFNDLLSGSALMNDTNQAIVLQFDDLADGVYQLTTYHHANFVNSTGASRLDILVADADRGLTRVHENVPTTAGTTPASFTTRTTEFSVSAGSPVTLYLDGQPVTSGPEHANLNGFELDQISPIAPIPSLNIDFSRSNAAGPTQAGFLAFEADGNGPSTQSFAHPLGSAGMVDVTIAGQCCYRDYAPATGSFAPLSDLLSDSPLLNAPGTLTLTLGDLADGRYEITTIHHTTQFGPSERPPATPFDIELTDAKFTDALILTGLTMSDNNSDQLSLATFEIQVSGGSPVVIDFIRGGNQGDGDHFALSGFSIRQAPPAAVPEPATLGLLGFGAFALLGRRRRRA